ncbi:MAG: DUF3137 domain-containing protein [Oscillospiraceae bacterium]|nr:DUF3137 domain-containing protein [Oscillospiraceae bacterium]
MSQVHDNFSKYKSGVAALKLTSALFLAVGNFLIISAIYTGNEKTSLSLPELLRGIMLLLGFGTLVASIVLAIIATRKGWKLKELVTENVTKVVLSQAFELIEYAPKKALSHAVIEDTKLITDWDTRSGSDYIRGKYKGYGFEFSDIELSETVTITTDGETTITTYNEKFKGQWIILYTKKELPTVLRLRKKVKSVRMKSSVETENMAFNSKYQIEANDPHGAFLILTPHFMEKVTHADTLANGRTFVYFGGRKVHIAIYNKRNLFEFSARKKAHSSIDALMELQRKEVKYITDILDVFLSNESLFG